MGNIRSDKLGKGIDYENVGLSLAIAGNVYTGASGYFESSFDAISNQIGDQYQLKNCYGCMYGDYRVYGQSAFGSMLCFRNQKEGYRKVTDKDTYMDLAAPEMYVQEIYCCDQYEIREKGAGYRG